MAKVKTYSMTKYDGTVRSRDGIHRWLDNALDSCSNGEYQLSFSRKQEPRSLDQNRLMWLWFSCISDETGSSKEEVHAHYCRKFLSTHIVFNGTREEVILGTSRLDMETMTMFLDRVQADASSELGITLPNPDDLNFESFKEQYKNYL